MEQPGTPDARGPLADPPWDVQVTIIMPAPRGRSVRARIARVPAIVGVRVAVALLVVLAGVGAVFVGTAHEGRAGGASATPAAELRIAGPAAVAAAYRYPLGCLAASISTSDRASVAGRLHRAGPCWRYGVYVTVIFHRVHGVWRLALEAVSSSCPVVSPPAVVRAQLAVCRRHPQVVASRQPEQMGANRSTRIRRSNWPATRGS